MEWKRSTWDNWNPIVMLIVLKIHKVYGFFVMEFFYFNVILKSIFSHNKKIKNKKTLNPPPSLSSPSCHYIW
jgi:hypothetical protein